MENSSKTNINNWLLLDKENISSNKINFVYESWKFLNLNKKLDKENLGKNKFKEKSWINNNINFLNININKIKNKKKCNLNKININNSLNISRNKFKKKLNKIKECKKSFEICNFRKNKFDTNIENLKNTNKIKNKKIQVNLHNQLLNINKIIKKQKNILNKKLIFKKNNIELCLNKKYKFIVGNKDYNIKNNSNFNFISIDLTKNKI